jgi:hypothetical protein
MAADERPAACPRGCVDTEGCGCDWNAPNESAALGYEGAYLQPTKYLRFESEANPGRKTGVWTVVSQSSGFVLGRIAWYRPWRQYVFFPVEETLYNVDCLVAIADRVATCNRWHRNIRANLAGAAS